ncbi:ABC transporter substrate-binding protein [Nonomuraea fastidiosa]|uniref:ABC transporter substrate-binding protein n=1 Tax=Nonomuraea TaxID=83681 RepID=UPI0032490A03
MSRGYRAPGEAGRRRQAVEEDRTPRRRPSKRTYVKVLSALALVAAVGTLSAGPTSSAQVGGDGVFRVGALVPKTGGLQFFNRPMAAGVRLAVADINAAGGVYGRPVAAIETDSGDSDRHVIPALTRLLAQRANVVVGPVTSSMSLAIADHVKHAGVVQISPTAASDRLTGLDDDGLIFRMAGPDANQGRLLAHLIEADGARRVGILARGDAYGAALSGHVRDALQVPARVETYDAAAKTYAEDVKKIKAWEPDAIVIAGFTETADLARELVRQGLGSGDHRWYFGDGYLANGGDTAASLPPGILDGAKAAQAGRRCPRRSSSG